ncbi:MAG TPA: DUF4129 domain-containing protein [Methylomirabilota bacterium]|nr:DUF4129 domain-containing protein [Methylomirabilota bacterium]
MEHGWGTRLRAGVVIGAGLLLALAATAGPLPLPGGDPGGSLTLRLPQAVQMVVVALLALSVLLLLALQRPRRPVEDEPLLSRAPQRRSVWSAVLALLPLLVLVGALWYLLWHRWSGEEGHPIETAITAIAGLLDLLASARKAPTSVPFFDFTVAALVLLFALATFALMVLVTLSGPLEKWWARRAGAAGATLASAALDDRPDDLRAEADARAAVIRAYGRFEHALAGAHVPRAPWQTPAEFMHTTLDRLAVPAGAVRQLTALFEVARFSDRPVGADARDAACDCLDAITAALETEPPPSGSEVPPRAG